MTNHPPTTEQIPKKITVVLEPDQVKHDLKAQRHPVCAAVRRCFPHVQLDCFAVPALTRRSTRGKFFKCKSNPVHVWTSPTLVVSALFAQGEALYSLTQRGMTAWNSVPQLLPELKNRVEIQLTLDSVNSNERLV